MRFARTSLWLALFTLGSAVPAFCQVIVPPNWSGRTIPADQGTVAFETPVFSTGPFSATLLVFRNAQLRFVASGSVCTSGPTTTLSINVPFGQFGLVAGDTITFALAVRHSGTEGNTSSVVLSVIPVVAGSSSSPPPPPTSKVTGPPDGPGPRGAGRREEAAL